MSKVLKNGIPASTYYELLEWIDYSSNERREILYRTFGSYSLSDLEVYQLKALHLIAFKKDMKYVPILE